MQQQEPLREVQTKARRHMHYIVAGNKEKSEEAKKKIEAVRHWGVFADTGTLNPPGGACMKFSAAMENVLDVSQNHQQDSAILLPAT